MKLTYYCVEPFSESNDVNMKKVRFTYVEKMRVKFLKVEFQVEAICISEQAPEYLGPI